MTLEQHLTDLFDASLNLLSDIKPSDWAEANRIMSSSESRWEGRFDYSLTPYAIEIINRFSPDDAARIIAVMKGAQLGLSKGVLENLIGYLISEHPCNILHLTGHADLAEEGTENIDLMIDGCGLRHLIRDSKINSRKTGDTAKRKLFMGGKYISGSVTNHKLLAQRSIKVTLVDDYDKGKQSSKESGSTRKLIEQRAASFGGIGKIGFFSTPELRPSNIEEVFLLGDQRYYNVPCPCCGVMIPLKWSVPIANTDGKEKGGIHWKVDKTNRLIKESVGYVCQECSNLFTDKHKYEMNLAGVWMPTAEPSQEGYYSYHISSLYAPVGMFDWEHYIRDYIEANPPEGQKEHLQKTLVNLCWGEPFEQTGKAPKGNDLQKNTRNYEIGTIPERMSINDGNGEFVLLTCGADMNGVVDDARLDYEVVGWTESGASYSICHGSIGTFIPRENSMKIKVDRERWTYDFNSPRSVWPEFAKVLSAYYPKDTGKRMQITCSGLDTGHYTQFAYNFIDNTNLNVVGLKGKDADKYIPIQKDIQSFHYAKERNKLFLVEVNYLKDRLAERISLKWRNGDGAQPAGFMNFPQPGNGLYGWSNFFEHYESEHWVVENKDGQIVGAKWEKKSSISQNHLFDVAVYNMATRDIFVQMILDQFKVKHGAYADFVKIIMGTATTINSKGVK
jgi:phage terminase large subunit GpA-like protein